MSGGAIDPRTVDVRDYDPYGDAVMRDPWPYYAALRREQLTAPDDGDYIEYSNVDCASDR